jgi:hypothetical protein
MTSNGVTATTWMFGLVWRSVCIRFQTNARSPQMVSMSPATNTRNTFWRWLWAAESIAPSVSRPLSTVRTTSSSMAPDTGEGRV